MSTEVLLPALRLTLLSSTVFFCYPRGCMPFLPAETSSPGMLAGNILQYLRDTLRFERGGN